MMSCHIEDNADFDDNQSEELNRLMALLKIAEEEYEIEELNESMRNITLLDCLPLLVSDSTTSLTIEVKRLDHFWIDRNLNHNTSKAMPRLRFQTDCRHIDLDLNQGFDDKCLIENYDKYWHLKWFYLLKTIKDQELIQRCEPQFISFGGVIEDILATIYDKDCEWRLLARKTKGVIYMHKKKDDSWKNSKQSGFFQEHSYRILKYNHFVTDGQTVDISEREKCFAINTLQLGDHRILCLSELNAIDQNGQSIVTKLKKSLRGPKDRKFYSEKKLLRFSGRALLTGADKIVIGTTKHEILKSIEVETRASIESKCADKWSAQHCLQFINRFFQYVKDIVTDDNVYEFVHIKKNESIGCARVKNQALDIPEDGCTMIKNKRL